MFVDGLEEVGSEVKLVSGHEIWRGGSCVWRVCLPEVVSNFLPVARHCC